MISKTLTKIFGTKHEREMKLLKPLIQQINEYEKKISKLSDSQLQAKTVKFKEKI